MRQMEGLIAKGLLCARTTAEEWILLCDEDTPLPPDGYVVSFAPFHELRFTIPSHRFL